jgi:hypothetical protein
MIKKVADGLIRLAAAIAILSAAMLIGGFMWALARILLTGELVGPPPVLFAGLLGLFSALALAAISVGLLFLRSEFAK